MTVLDPYGDAVASGRIAYRPYRVLVADPPWQHRDKQNAGKRGAAHKYRTLAIDDLCRMRPPPMEDDSILLLWRVASMQEEAIRLLQAWGFKGPKSEIVWVKTGGRLGMGHYVRNVHETCLIGVKGKGAGLRLNAGVRSVFEAPRPVDERGKLIHSAKPSAFYDRVELLYPGPRCDLFARSGRPGWDCVGNELEGGGVPAGSEER